jgi:hypothetical protein
MNFANAFSFFGNSFASILKIQFPFSKIKKEKAPKPLKKF